MAHDVVAAACSRATRKKWPKSSRSQDYNPREHGEQDLAAGRLELGVGVDEVEQQVVGDRDGLGAGEEGCR